MRGTLPDPRLSILVVDDDPAIREALAAALTDSYTVHTAANGGEAYGCLQATPIAVIILDAILEEEHGLDLVPRFRALSAAAILVLTGFTTEELLLRALNAKVDGYLKKPVNLLEIRTAVNRLTAGTDPVSDPAERAHRLIAERPGQAYTTESLAQEIGVSERHLRRRFLEVYGKTPRRYLTETRMKRAAELLRTTSLWIEEIAYALGYPSGTTFGKIFKRRYGRTPSEFRRWQGFPATLHNSGSDVSVANDRNGRNFGRNNREYHVDSLAGFAIPTPISESRRAMSGFRPSSLGIWEWD